MHLKNEIDYAWKNTEIIHQPDRLIDSFGSTRFEFYFLSELMDSIKQVRVRHGELTTNKPQILTPSNYCKNQLEGFGKDTEQMFEWLEANKMHLSLLRYGFSFGRELLGEKIVNKDISDLSKIMTEKAVNSGNPLYAVIRGTDEFWEVCLLKFAIHMIENSTEFNLHDFKRKGIL